MEPKEVRVALENGAEDVVVAHHAHSEWVQPSSMLVVVPQSVSLAGVEKCHVRRLVVQLHRSTLSTEDVQAIASASSLREVVLDGGYSPMDAAQLVALFGTEAIRKLTLRRVDCSLIRGDVLRTIVQNRSIEDLGFLSSHPAQLVSREWHTKQLLESIQQLGENVNSTDVVNAVLHKIPLEVAVEQRLGGRIDGSVAGYIVQHKPTLRALRLHSCLDRPQLLFAALADNATLTRLEVVTVTSPGNQDGITELRDMLIRNRTLTSLTLKYFDVPLSDDTWIALQQNEHTALRELRIRRIRMTLDGLRALASSPSLTSLAMEQLHGQFHHVTKDVTAAIARNKSLSTLSLSYSHHMPVPAIVALTKLSSLTDLNLKCCQSLDDTAAIALGGMPNLLTLDLSDCTAVRQRGCAGLARSRSLTKLRMDCCHLTDKDVVALAKSTSIEVLSLSRFDHWAYEACGDSLTNKAVTALSRMPQLRVLNLGHHDAIGAVGWKAIGQRAVALEELSAKHCKFTPAAVRGLVQSESLRTLCISISGIASGDLKYFGNQNFTLTTLDLDGHNFEGPYSRRNRYLLVATITAAFGWPRDEWRRHFVHDVEEMDALKGRLRIPARVAKLIACGSADQEGDVVHRRKRQKTMRSILHAVPSDVVGMIVSYAAAPWFSFRTLNQ